MGINKIKLALADDSKVIIDGLSAIAAAFDDLKVAFTANSGEDLLNKLEITQADVIILDYRMPPGKNGKELCEIIKNEYPGTKVLMLSVNEDLTIIQDCLEAGADGYLLKYEAGNDELNEAIQSVINNETYFSKTILKKIIDKVGRREDNKSHNKKSSMLTDREIEVLLLICKEYTTKEIAKEFFRSINTVQTHRKNMLEKTGSKNSVGLALYAVKHGLLPNFQCNLLPGFECFKKNTS